MTRWQARALALVGVILAGCQERWLDAASAGKGEACGDVPGEEQAVGCAVGLVCEPFEDEDQDRCATPLELHGMVYDGVDESPIAGARVAALDFTGAPVSDVAITDAQGRYVLRVSARRDQHGAVRGDTSWTLFAAARGYQPFPGGIRPALPLDSGGARQLGQGPWIIENPTTDVALVPLADASGVSVAGRVGGDVPGGTLVVAEGQIAPAPYTIADLSGNFVLFDVPTGTAMIRGYRRGLELAPRSIDVGTTDIDGIELVAVSETIAELARVIGKVGLVNAGGTTGTSVVLVPTAVFDPVLERGPVPMGLRAPPLPAPPNVTADFTIDGVPAGSYQVLAAFENDGLVRDPDVCISGTQVVTVEVARGEQRTIETSFKVTGHLPVEFPGREGPEVVTSVPTLSWADDSSEDVYHLRVFDALGNIVWERLDIPAVQGASTVEVPYEGLPLSPNMIYQFRATSVREMPAETCPISRTEDLRGVFVFVP